MILKRLARVSHRRGRCPNTPGSFHYKCGGHIQGSLNWARAENCIVWDRKLFSAQLPLESVVGSGIFQGNKGRWRGDPGVPLEQVFERVWNCGATWQGVGWVSAIWHVIIFKSTAEGFSLLLGGNVWRGLVPSGQELRRWYSTAGPRLACNYQYNLACCARLSFRLAQEWCICIFCKSYKWARRHDPLMQNSDKFAISQNYI